VSVVIGILMAIHGIITLAIGGVAVGGAPTPPEMNRLPGAGWYPVPLGDSWLLHGTAARVGGVLWLMAGLGLLATAASMFGVGVPTSAWRAIGLISASTGLAALVVFFHPYYAIAIIVDVAIIAAATSLEATSRNALGI